MKILSNIVLGNDLDSKKINYLDWSKFEELANLIIEDIEKKKFDKNKICLLGAARGALPLLTYISHKTNIRNISVVQLQMTKSDIPFDYGEVKVLLKGIRNEFQDFIILEDIIYKGNTIKEILKLLKNKNVKEIYSLVIDEKYIPIEYKVSSACMIKAEQWIKFPWEC